MRNEYDIYDDICRELTNYENSTGPELSLGEWVDVFYDLLVRFQNAVDVGEIVPRKKMFGSFELYDEVTGELTNFEANEDPETTDDEWRDVFYHLLVKIQRAVDTNDLIFRKDMEESVKNKNPLEGIRSNIIEFPSGDYVYVGYADGKLFAGSATNAGVIHETEIDYDNDASVDANISNLYDAIVEKHPEYLDEVTEALTEDVDDDEKRKALADYLGLPVEEVKQGYDDNHFETEDGEEYIVCDEDTALQLAGEDIRNFIDELGISGFSEDFQEWIKENALDTDWFDEVQDEDCMSYVNDIESEESDKYENRFFEELDERGLVDKYFFEEDPETGKLIATENSEKDIDELKELFVDSMKRDYTNSIEWFVDSFGSDELDRVIKEGKVSFDENAIVDEVIDQDGIAHSLSTYDGEEIDLGDGLFAYRTN